MRTTPAGIACWIFVLCVIFYPLTCHRGGDESKLEFTIPPIKVYYYGMQGSLSPKGDRMTTTYKTSGCDPDRVIAAFNKVGIKAAYTTTHVEKECIDIEEYPPFFEMTISGASVTIVPNEDMTDEYPPYVLEKLATEIRWAH